MELTDKVAIVTGSGRGIGKGIAKILAKDGAKIIVADMNLDDALKVASEIDDLGSSGTPLRVDVTVQEAVDSMADSVISKFGQIDILVNNAGIIAAPGWEDRDDHSDEDWNLIYEINVKGMARVTEAILPHMQSRKYGKIVNIASIAGRIGSITSGPYSVSKAGVINYTQSTALEQAINSINLNAVCPGMLWTPLWNRIAIRNGSVQAQYQGLSARQVFDKYIEEKIPLGREQTPEDIGNAVAFLASDRAKNITGQALNVSGGSHFN